jgi:hypothetical protein
MKTTMPVKATLNEINAVIAKINGSFVIPMKGLILGNIKVAGSLIVPIIKDYVPEAELVALVGETPEIAEMRKKVAQLDGQADDLAMEAMKEGKGLMGAMNATREITAQAGELRKKIEEALQVDAAIERLVAQTIGKTELEPDKDLIAWRQEVNRVKEQWGGDGTVILMPKEDHIDLAVQKDETKKQLTVVASIFLKNDKGEVKSLSAIGHEISEILGNPGVNNGVNSTELWTGKLDEYKVVVPKVKKEVPAEPAPATEEPKLEPVAA